jgi:hypothetical protein
LLFNDYGNIFSGPYYDFNDLMLYENILFNSSPEFLNPSQNRLQISTSSPAAGAGINLGNLNTDITGSQRSYPADLGAYNAIEFEN